MQKRYANRRIKHFEREINDVLGGIEHTEGGPRRKAHIALVAGADLVRTMSTPGVWAQEDLDKILSEYGVFMYVRTLLPLIGPCMQS